MSLITLPVATPAVIDPPVPPVATSELLFGDWFLSLGQESRYIYQKNWQYFSQWWGVQDAGAELLRLGHERANRTVWKYREALQQRKLAPNTINLRLSSVRSFVEHCYRAGIIDWQINVRGLKKHAYKDTRGPEREDYLKYLRHLQQCADAHTLGVRNLAIVRLLHDCGLREVEVHRLDVADVDIVKRRVAVLGKGQHDKLWITTPDPTTQALTHWMCKRQETPGALFLNDRGKRLTTRSIRRMVTITSQAAGIAAIAPHQLRHAAITRALVLTNGNVQAVQKFARHKDPKTTMIYDDNRNDLAGMCADLIASE